MSSVIVYVGDVKALTSVHSSSVETLYFKFHKDSLAPGVQDTVAEVLEILLYVNAVGTGHATVVVNDIMFDHSL